MKTKKARENDGATEQFNGREGETAALFVGLSVKLRVAWWRFRPTSSQPFDCFAEPKTFMIIEMKKTAILSLTLLLLFASSAFSQNAAPQAKVEISTFNDGKEPVKTECFKVGETIKVIITVTNLSDKKLSMPVGLDYSRPTLFRNGEVVAIRKEIDNHWKYDSYSSLRTLFTLEKANQNREETIELEDAYEPMKVGEYQLSLEKRFWIKHSVWSNTVLFKVAYSCSE